MFQENKQTFKGCLVWRFNYIYDFKGRSEFKNTVLGVNALNTHLFVPKTAHNCRVIIYASKTQARESENIKRAGLVTFSFPRIK